MNNLLSLIEQTYRKESIGLLNLSIFFTANVIMMSQIPAAFVQSFGSITTRTTGIARGSAAVQSTLCTRRDNNLLTRTCRLR